MASYSVDGLYYCPENDDSFIYVYGQSVYDASSGTQGDISADDLIHIECIHVPTFNVFADGSEVITVLLLQNNQPYLMMYQERNGNLVELTPRPRNAVYGDRIFEGFHISRGPHLPPRSLGYRLQFLGLSRPTLSHDHFDDILYEYVDRTIPNEVFDRILGNQHTEPSHLTIQDKSTEILNSYKTLVSNLYNLPIEPLPGLISFDQVANLLQNGRIVNFKLDPILQPWSGLKGDRIITLISRDGTNYMVKAQYNPETNSIYPPLR